MARRHSVRWWDSPEVMPMSTESGALSARGFKVSEILDLAKKGRLRVPDFQRPLRWRGNDHRLLLDSLARGYPVGTLLLWEHDALEGVAHFGSVAFEAPKDARALWIVDGQQRITSIVGCILAARQRGRTSASEFAFVFDLEQRTFLADVGQAPPRFVPVPDLVDAVATSVWARANGVSDEVHRRAQQVGNQLREYEVPAYVAHVATDEELRVIFARSNTAGKKMRAEEVFDALHLVTAGDRRTGLTRRIQLAVADAGFGTPDAKYAQKAIIGVGGRRPTSGVAGEFEVAGGAVKYEARAVTGALRALEFLRDVAELPHLDVLPYGLPFVILPAFFDRYPSATERSLRLLARWVWRGIAAEAHAVTNQHIQTAWRAMQSTDEESAVQRLLATVPKEPPIRRDIPVRFDSRGAATRVVLAAALRLRPVRLGRCGGSPLTPAEVFEVDDDGNRLPLPVLPGSPATRPSVGARLLHSQPKSSETVLSLLLESPPEALGTHAIEPDEVRTLSTHPNAATAVDELIQARARRLADSARRLIEAGAAWDEDDAPSTAWLLSGRGAS